MQENGSDSRPVESGTIHRKQKHDVPYGNFTEKVRMPAVFEKALSDKADPILGWQFFSHISISTEKPVLLGLEFPHLLISYHFADEQCDPGTGEEAVDDIELSLISSINGRGKPLDKDVLVVGDEEEVKEFYQNPMEVLPNVNPSVVLSSLAEASFSGEVVSESQSPDRDHQQHHYLSGRNRVWGALLLMIEIVGSVEDGKEGPESINPGVFPCKFVEKKAESSDGQSAHQAVVNCRCFAVVGVGQVGELFPKD